MWYTKSSPVCCSPNSSFPLLPPFSPHPAASILLIFSFPLSVNFFPIPHLQPQPHPPDKSSPLNQATEFLSWPVARLILATVTDSPYGAVTWSHLGRARGLYHTPIHCILESLDAAESITFEEVELPESFTS
ncbi:unnamed protein product [Coffea canephora]|uniref:DH200=94 genomic scaffold, scaffold_771 n=1 Tax=Coffea canephora TaxID=49390 RepID=A0A068VJQ2_COFCA|nr:unnamed protein product [Coffea canephora]